MQLVMIGILLLEALRNQLPETFGEPSSAVLVDVPSTFVVRIYQSVASSILRSGLDMPAPVPITSINPSLAWQFGRSPEDYPLPQVPGLLRLLT